MNLAARLMEQMGWRGGGLGKSQQARFSGHGQGQGQGQGQAWACVYGDNMELTLCALPDPSVTIIRPLQVVAAGRVVEGRDTALSPLPGGPALLVVCNLT